MIWTIIYIVTVLSIVFYITGIKWYQAIFAGIILGIILSLLICGIRWVNELIIDFIQYLVY